MAANNLGPIGMNSWSCSKNSAGPTAYVVKNKAFVCHRNLSWLPEVEFVGAAEFLCDRDGAQISLDGLVNRF